MKKLFSALLLAFFTTSAIAMQQPDPNTILLTINKDPITIQMFENYLKTNGDLISNKTQKSNEYKLEALFSYMRQIISTKATTYVSNNVLNLYSRAVDSGLMGDPTISIAFNWGSTTQYVISSNEVALYGHYINELLNANSNSIKDLLNTVDGLTSKSNTLEDFYNRIIKPLDSSNTLTFAENIGHVFTIWYGSEFKNFSKLDNEYAQSLMEFTQGFSLYVKKALRSNFEIIPASNARELFNAIQF